MKDEKTSIVEWISIILMLYVTAATLRFRYDHPWLTETQLALHIVDALAWKTIERP